MQLTVQSPEELVAALPHLIGFNPTESVILVPFTPALPVARIDLPRTPEEREEMARTLRGAFLRHAPQAGPDPMLAVVCLSQDRAGSELAAEAIANGLAPQLQVPIRLWADDPTRSDLQTDRTGPRSEATAGRIAAEMVASGRQLPAAHREDLHSALIGDRSPVTAALPAAHDHWRASSVDSERRWLTNRIDRFLDDGIGLSDVEAARALVAVQALPVRDAAWAMMDHEDRYAHRAMWSDLTRRAPDEVRTPAATLLAFSSWLGGDGAGAWVALDQIPEDPGDYRMATLVASAIQGALPPSEWAKIRPALLPDAATAPDVGLDERAPPEVTHRARPVPPTPAGVEPDAGSRPPAR